MDHPTPASDASDTPAPPPSLPRTFHLRPWRTLYPRTRSHIVDHAIGATVGLLVILAVAALAGPRVQFFLFLGLALVCFALCFQADPPAGTFAAERLARRTFRTPPEHVEDCLGWKLARIRAQGPHLWLEGVAGGHYGAHEEGVCSRGETHPVPDPACTCGFHIWRERTQAETYANELAAWEADALVLLQVELSGDILEYTLGFRGQHQDVLGILLPPCPCRSPATHLEIVPRPYADLVHARCASCALPGSLTFGEASSRLGVEIGTR